jgi:hypothetical protein
MPRSCSSTQLQFQAIATETGQIEEVTDKGVHAVGAALDVAQQTLPHLLVGVAIEQ